MKIKDAINMANLMEQGNVLPKELAILFLSELDGMIQSDIMLHAPEEIVSYTNEEQELLLRPPHDKLYVHYLVMMIRNHQQEYEGYQNTQASVEEKLKTFRRWYVQHYRPADTDSRSYTGGTSADAFGFAYLTAYGLAVKHGYQGTEEEWLESLIGQPGEAARMRYDEDREVIQWGVGDTWYDMFPLSALRDPAVDDIVYKVQAAVDTARGHAHDAGVSSGEASAAATAAANSATAAAQSAQKASSAANAVGSAVAAAREQADRAAAAADRAEAAGNGSQGGGGIAVTPQVFGAAGDGETDDTAAIQAMFDAVGDGGLIYFPAGTYVVRHSDTKTGEDYVAVTVRGRHGLRIVLDNGATLLHKTTTVHRYTMLRFDGCDGIEISGGVIEGDRQSHQAGATSYGSKGIHIVDSANIFVHDMEVREIYGDCIGVTGVTAQCEQVVIENCDLHDSYRNGITIGGARNSTVRNCHIYGIVGGDPQAGIDLEAERGIANADITIEGCRIHDCGRNTIAFSANGTGTMVRDCRLDGNTIFDNTHTGVEITGTAINGTANFQNDVVLRGCSVTAVGCYDTTDHPGVSLTAYNTIFKGNDGTPTININGINGAAVLRLVGCELNQPESSAYALIYSYNATDVDVAMDGCTVNLRNGTALHRQLAHGKYRAFSMAGCTIAVRSATMDYSFIRTDADQVRISNCTIDLSGVESYNPAEIGYFWNRNSAIEFNGNVILNTVAISNVLCLEGFTGTAHITNNTAPMCGAMVKVAGSSGTVVEKGNITANSTGGGGADGITPHIGANGNWYIGTTDTGVKAKGTDGAPGDPGRGIASVERTSGNGAAGTVDTYTITYTDGTTSTYQVRNGADGKDVTIETQTWTFTMTDGSVVEMEVAARAVQ